MISHVVLLMLRPAGRAGEMRQFRMMLVVVAVCVAALPIVSTTVLGENDTVGGASTPVKVSVAVSVPVALVAVTVTVTVLKGSEIVPVIKHALLML